MKKVKLGEVCEIVTGSTPKSTNPDYWNGEYKWITPAEISDDDFIIVDTQRKISKLGIEKTGLKSFPIGTVLLSSRAPIGKVAIAGCEMYCNQGFKNFICSNEINNEYLYYFLKSRKNFLNNIGRGATFKEISKSIISNIEIILPSYNVQCTQTQNLKKIDNLIYLRNKVIKEYQLLVKSRFNEMFGSKKFDKVSISELVDDRIETAKKKFDQHDTIKYIDISSIDNKNYKMTGFQEYMLNQAPSRAQQHIRKGDIVVSTVRPNLKNIAITELDDENLVASSGFCVLRALKCLPEYLFAIICSDRFTNKMTNIVTGANYPAIKSSDIMNYIVPLPPIQLQNEFADFVAQVDKSQLAIQKSLEELETLKKSLMQEYFG